MIPLKLQNKHTPPLVESPQWHLLHYRLKCGLPNMIQNFPSIAVFSLSTTFFPPKPPLIPTRPYAEKVSWLLTHPSRLSLRIIAIAESHLFPVELGVPHLCFHNSDIYPIMISYFIIAFSHSLARSLSLLNHLCVH